MRALVSVSVRARERAGHRHSRRRRSATWLRGFWRVMMDGNVTGSSAMVAYNLLLGVLPVALLALFIGGQILSSHSIQQSVVRDLRGIFLARRYTLDPLRPDQSSTTSTACLRAGERVARLSSGSAGHRVSSYLPLRVAPVA